MITIALISLLLATLHRRRDGQKAKAISPGTSRWPAAALAALIAFLGIVSLLSIILRS